MAEFESNSCFSFENKTLGILGEERMWMSMDMGEYQESEYKESSKKDTMMGTPDEREGDTCLKRGLKNFEQCLTEENDERAIGNFQLHA